MKFFSLQNLTSSTVTPVEQPWELVKTFDQTPLDKSDQAYAMWAKSSDTKSAFLSMTEGVSSNVRINKDDNQARLMYGIFADYDTTITESDIQRWATEAPCEFKPAYGVRTRSGGARLVWFFEKPVPIALWPQFKKFNLELSKRLCFKDWAPSLDTKPIDNPATYFHIGREWYEIDVASRVPTVMLDLWMYSCIMSKDVKFGDGSGKPDAVKDVPMDKVAAELENRFPGRWTGPVIVGARGVTVWDEASTNTTSAVILNDGIYSFSADPSFKSWRSLFGPGFMDKVASDKIGPLVRKTAYDGDKYYTEEDGVWAACSKADFVQQLKVKGFSPRMDTTSSEIDRTEVQLKRLCKVHRAAPFIYYPQGIMEYGGNRYLNISTVRVLQPRELPLTVMGAKLEWIDGKRNFPFIWDVITGLFAPNYDKDAQTPADVICRHQLHVVMGWLKVFYESGYYMKPRQGTCMVLAGNTGKGKTFFSRYIVGDLMSGNPGAGFADATRHLTENSRWTGHIADKPVMSIDDAIAANDPHSLARFTNGLKGYAANATILYEDKNEKIVQLPWFGRPMLSCNLDVDSMRIVPNLGSGTKDKVTLTLVSDNQRADYTSHDVMQTLAAELPAFARFLLDWEIPADVERDARFGVKSWHHPDLFRETLLNGPTTQVLEVLDKGLKEMVSKDPSVKYWNGSASDLFEMLRAISPEVTRTLKPGQVASALGLLQKNGYNVVHYRKSGSPTRSWRIGTDIMGVLEPMSPAETEGTLQHDGN